MEPIKGEMYEEEGGKAVKSLNMAKCRRTPSKRHGNLSSFVYRSKVVI
jgi:hypothetical protein